MRLALSVVAALLLAGAVHADEIVNIQTNNIVFAEGNGSTDTLALCMQEDLTTGTVLNFSSEFTQGSLAGLNLTLAGSGPYSNSFLLVGQDILMNFGVFDYDVEEYYPGLQFPLPGVYGPDIFYDNSEIGSRIASWPESGSVTVSEVPEISTFAMLLTGILVLVCFKCYTTAHG